ncbi:MAG: glycoside hydrolase family 57 protein [Gammaproteobacteria bacterium]
MSVEQRLKVVLCWHMHQPQYRLQDEYALPWTYLHATKDYVDMAAHLEADPEARAVVNFAPILLEQIDDYAHQVRDHLEHGSPLRDPLLSALVAEQLPTDPKARFELAETCLKANRHRLIDPFPRYRLLADLIAWVREHPAACEYLNDAVLGDLLVWYHLAWIGETVRRNDMRVRRLLEKQGGYTLEDRRSLLGVMSELLSGLIPRYRVLAELGRVELSMTPYAHPIMPLLLDIGSTLEAMPEAPLPDLERYPGGEDRVRWHLQRGIEVFERHFGIRPRGCWPSEGSVSASTLKLLGEQGFNWTASGETVLSNSLRRSGLKADVADKSWLYRCYQMDNEGVACFFRDDGLSDAIGFEYRDWHADHAVANLVHHLENIAKRTNGRGVVSIVLDGENAWEYYPNNGYYFLSALYPALAANPLLELTTYSRVLEDAACLPLPRMVAGSWVYGSFSTWIGEPDKNRGWEMLGEAKQAFDRAVAEGRLTGEALHAAEDQLAICEGSDWCWWFGDYNPSGSVSDFESLYRRHLTLLYEMLGEPAPDYLQHRFTHGGGEPAAGGTMRHGQQPN